MPVHRLVRGLLALGLVTLAPLGVSAQPGPKPDPKEQAAIVALQDLGARVSFHKGDSGLSARYLGCSGVKNLPAVVPHLRNLKKLEHLELVASPAANFDPDLGVLAKMQDLQILILFGTAVGDEGLAQIKGLKKVRKLDLSNTRVTDAGLVHLQQMADLSYLRLGGTQVTDAGLAHLARLTTPAHLELHNLKVTDAELPRLQALKKLEVLGLSGSKVTDAGAADLAKLSGLRRLDLNKTALTDRGLAHLARLTELKVLRVSYTQVTSAGLKTHLKGLTKLESLAVPAALCTPELEGELRKFLPKLDGLSRF